MGAVTLALLGAIAAYQIQSQQPGSALSGTAALRRHSMPLADNVSDWPGNGRAGRLAGGAKSDKGSQTEKAAEPRQPGKAKPAQPASATGHTRAPAARGGTSGKSRQSSGSTVNLRSAVQKDVTSGNYLLAVGQYLVEHGYSRAAAAGVASCVDGESTGDPESVGTGGGGLIGWTPISSAQPNANIITGNAAHDMMTQLADILYYDSTEIGQSLVAQLNGISDPVAAADFYSQNFEKPAVTDSDVRQPVAEQIFSELGG